MQTGGNSMKRVLVAIIKLAMDAQMSDQEIAKDLLAASRAVGEGKFWSWSRDL
jgi:hypothetical protein